MLLSIHNLVNVEFASPPERLETYLRTEFPVFCRSAPCGDPDIVVRFVPHIESKQEIRLWPFASFDGCSMYHVDKYGAKAMMPFATMLDKPCIVISETNVIPSVLFDVIFMPIIRHRLLEQEITFVHASAVKYNGEGWVFPAWSGTGKTNLIVRFLTEGQAEYMGDDLALISSDGRLYGFPERLYLFDYNFREFPELLRLLSPALRVRFALKRMVEWSNAALGARFRQDSVIRAVLQKLASLSKSLVAVQVDPWRISKGSEPSTSAELCTVVFLLKSLGKELSAEPGECKAFAERVTACIQQEFIYFAQLYNAFLYACPGQRISFIEEAPYRQTQVVERAFRGKCLNSVYVPAEASSAQVFELVKKLGSK